MYRSILVPLDGTTFGEHALPVARGIARRLGATLHLVHVHTPVHVPAAVESLPFLGTPLSPESLTEEREYLESVAERLEEDELRVTTELVEGPLTESLERYAIERGADLVVACTHCHEGVSRFWHRGVGEQLLHDISLPVLLIRPAETGPAQASEAAFRHMLIPLNGTPFAEEILDEAIPLGHVLGVRFTLIRVVRPMMVVGYTLLAQDAHVNHFLLEEQQREAQLYLDRIAERLRAGGLEVHTRVISAEEPAQAIVAATGEAGEDGEAAIPPVDLIAMTTHSRGALSRVVMSSVTNEVLQRTPVPLLLHHPHGLEEQAEALPQSRSARAQDLMERGA